MAIFHCETKPIKRSGGRSAVASSAYRAGEKLIDERTGKTHDYTKKSGVVAKDCFMFQNGEKVTLSRSDLWNVAEKSENRKDGRTGRDYIINLPHELKDQQREKLTQDIAELLAKRFGVAVDYAIHRPDKKGDQRNHHCHILTTTRTATLDQYNNIQLGEKTSIEKKNADLKKLGLPTTQEQIKQVRADIADLINKHLEQAEIGVTVDSRSYAEQGKDQLPTIKLGTQASEFERQGIATRKGDINRLVKQANKEGFKGSIEEYITKRIDDLEHEIIFESRKPTEPTAPSETNKPTIGKPVEKPAPVAPQVAPVTPQPAPATIAPKPPTVAPTAPTYANAIDEYETTHDKLAMQFLKEDLKALAEKGKPLLAEYNRLKDNKPSLWSGERGKWKKDLAQALDEYEKIKTEHDNMKEWGTRFEDLTKASKHIRENNPDLYERYMLEKYPPKVAKPIEPVAPKPAPVAKKDLATIEQKRAFTKRVVLYQNMETIKHDFSLAENVRDKVNKMSDSELLDPKDPRFNVMLENGNTLKQDIDKIAEEFNRLLLQQQEQQRQAEKQTQPQGVRVSKSSKGIGGYGDN